jgi:hypothetical protein
MHFTYHVLARRYLIHTVIGLLALAAVLIVWRIVSRWKQQLSYLIWKEKNRIFGYRFYDHVLSYLRDIYNPSFSSASIIFAAILTVWGSALYFRSSTPSTTEESQLITRLQNLDSGIALVFVPFTIFAVGLSSRRTEGGVNAAEVLLSKTYIFPITVFVLGLLATFTLITSVDWAKGLIFVTLAFAAFAVFTLCRILLDEERLYASAIKLLQDKIRRTIGMAIDERIGRNLFLQQLDSKPIEYSPSSRVLGGKYFEIKATRKGVVKDINLHLLFTFVKALERTANDYGFSFGPKQVAENILPEQGLQLTPVRFRNLESNKHRYILKLFGDEITEFSDTLVSFSRVLVQDTYNRQHLEDQARDAFSITQGDNSSRRVERYLGLVKDQAISAIKEHRTTYLESLLAVYAKVVGTFLEEMKKAIGGHSLQAALTERHSLFGGWSEITWMSRHLSEIYYKGCRSEDIYIARLVATAPFGIALSSIRYRDNLVFDQFTSFVQPLYSAVDEIKDPKIKKMLFNTCLAYMKDIGIAGIEPELRRPSNRPEDLEKIGSLATVLLVRYEELLKLSFDKKHFEHFEDFKQGVDELFQYAAPRPIPLPGSPQSQRPSAALLAEDRANLEEEEERNKMILVILENIELQKRQLLFAIGSHVFACAISSNQDPVHKCLTEIDGKLSTSPFELAELYIGIGKPETDQLWGRAFYADWPEGAWLDSRGTEYFCYLLLKTTYQYSDEQFLRLELPTEVSFVSNLRDDGPTAATLRRFREERDKWKKLIPDDWLQAIPMLEQVFARATANQKRAEDDQIIQSPIDHEYINAFRTRFAREFENDATMRKVFKIFKAYRDEASGPSGSGPKWGLNVIDMKQAYTTDGSKLYFNWPEEYARKLATSESEFVFHQILQDLPECNLSGYEGLEAKIAAVVHETNERGIRPNVILVARQSPLSQISDRLQNFTPRWFVKSDLATIWGFLGHARVQDRDVPVFAIWTNQDVNFGCALELPSGCVWTQRSPADSSTELADTQGVFYIRIVDLSTQTEDRKNILQSNPTWLSAQADRERYLSLRVRLQISERFDITLIPSKAGFKFDLSS